MPVLVDRGLAGCHILVGHESAAELAPARRHPAGAEWIEIGLVNNMPEAALEATEQQFLQLLGAAAGDSWVHLRFFALPSVPRSERGRSHLKSSYSELGDVREADLDGLIVTGTEPKAANLADEPYWAAFTQLVDWAGRNTISTVWSCLAAHAAVLHLDRIARTPLPKKCFGVFDCEKVVAHPLTRGLPARIALPHARWNEIGEGELAANGYDVLTRSPRAGVDTFLRQDQSLFLFFQGHPEYDSRALLNEFRRDVGRFLRGEREQYPGMPRHYFDAPTEAALAAFAMRAVVNRDEKLFAEFPASGPVVSNGSPTSPWYPFAAGIYRNWLTHLSAEKQRLQGPTRYLASLRLDKASAPAV